MSGATIAWIVVAIVLIALVVALIIWAMNRLYRRSSKETSFVRTGLGGQKVVMNGGAFVLPIVHEITPVNMNTLRLEVRRGRESALITKNRMRVDVVAEFYVRVKAEAESVATAAGTLGRRTLQPDGLKELVEGKFIDALRSVAAETTMEEMHEKRGDYVKRVQQVVAADLMQNGLELESVSLTGMDQTNMEYFNPSNAFDAEGLTRLTDEIERRKKIRNDIEQDTLIQIRNKNLETEKVSLEIDRDSEYARLEQQREIEARRASQQADVARERATSERQTEEAKISSQLEIEKARIAQERALDEDRIARERDTQRLEVQRRQALELAEQERAIAIAQQSKAQSEAQAEAERARAEAVAAEEQVFTARDKEVAERRKAIEMIQARQEAERQALTIQLAAEAEKLAAADKAEASRIAAEADAEAEKIRALADKLRYEIEAEGKRQSNEAANILTPESRGSEMRLRLIEKLDAIIRESVKPMERIEGIKILHVDGLTGGQSSGPVEGAGGQSLADNVVNSALRYRAQAPLVDQLLREIGIEGGDVTKLTGVLGDGPAPKKDKDEER
ncbi:MAG: flotillin domain-containing protein [Kiloniellales bacterium]